MMEYLSVLFCLVLSHLQVAQSQGTFSISLLEEIEILGSSSNSCFNRTSKAISNNVTGQLNSFKLSRGVIKHVAYENINTLGNGDSNLSFKAEFKCCSIFCERFSRQLSEWTWVSGIIKMDVAGGPIAGIYHNNVLICHSDYLVGFFASAQFTPFQLEGESMECIHKVGNRHYKTYAAVGMVQRITAVPGSDTITVKFAFSVTSWSKDFMLKFMKENEHGTLVNINADVIVKEVIYQQRKITSQDIYFIAVNGFSIVVLILALILVLCMRTKLGFLPQTWVTYDEYMKMKQRDNRPHIGIDNIALDEI